VKNFQELAQELEKYFFTIEYREKNRQFYSNFAKSVDNAKQNQKTNKIGKVNIKKSQHLQKIYVRLVQILKCELFRQKIKKDKPIYRVWYQQKDKLPCYFLLDTYQKHREKQLDQLSVGSVSNLVLNQGQVYQFFYGFG